MATPIGTLGNVPAQNFGGLYLPLNLPVGANILRLYGSTASSEPYTSPRLANGTSGYQVTSGKTFYCLTVRIISPAIETNASTHTATLGYNNADLGIAGTTPPTSPVYFFGTSTDGLTLLPLATQSTAPYVDVPIDFQIPATKYPFFTTNGSGAYAYILIGYEA